ncbi:MAG: hypothetical protein FWF92_07650 [Oscillospiraceae bacterium]|nr:hypothetical protein [Oscillospiraceae bacterium]
MGNSFAGMGSDDQIVGGGNLMGFGGGNVGLLILIFLFFAVFANGGLFGRDGRRDGGHDGDGCGIRACRPGFYDESNFEEERNLNNKLCMDTEKIMSQAAKYHDEDLYYKLNEKDMVIQKLEAEKYSDAKFGNVYAELGKIGCEISHIPHTPPMWAAACVPCNTKVETGCGGRRDGCDGERFF